MFGASFLLVLLFSGFIGLSTSSPTQRRLDVQVSPNGSFAFCFKINWIDQFDCWLKSGPLMVRSNDKVYSSEDGSLTVKPGSFNEVANTKMGPSRRYAWTWINADNSLEVITEIQVYYQPPDYPYPEWYGYGNGYKKVVFFMDFNLPLNNTKGSPDDIQASFPSFIPTDSQDTRGWMTYYGGSACVCVCVCVCVCLCMHACKTYVGICVCVCYY